MTDETVHLVWGPAGTLCEAGPGVHQCTTDPSRVTCMSCKGLIRIDAQKRKRIEEGWTGIEDHSPTPG